MDLEKTEGLNLGQVYSEEVQISYKGSDQTGLSEFGTVYFWQSPVSCSQEQWLQIIF